jgi:iron(III) transport system substrate-binding protein
VDLSGVALMKNSPNKANAMKFIEWMVGQQAQQMHADLNYEYPIRSGVPINKTIAGYGALKADSVPLAQIASNRKKASALVDKVGFDN